MVSLSLPFLTSQCHQSKFSTFEGLQVLFHHSFMCLFFLSQLRENAFSAGFPHPLLAVSLVQKQPGVLPRSRCTEKVGVGRVGKCARRCASPSSPAAGRPLPPPVRADSSAPPRSGCHTAGPRRPLRPPSHAVPPAGARCLELSCIQNSLK